MRLRYIAAAGAEEGLDSLSKALVARGEPPLALIMETAGVRLWAPPGTPIAIGAHGRAAMVGLLFERAGGGRCERLPSMLPSPKGFTARYWGAYVLLRAEEDGHLFQRDPSGGVDACHRRSRGIDVYASDAELLRRAAPEPLDPDLEFVRQWLTYPFLRTARTGAAGVREILPGTVRRCAGRLETVETIWSPWEHAGKNKAIHNFDMAASLLRDELCRTVPKLAESAGDVVVHLSGGLDSSIVAAALATSGMPFRAVTFATRAPDGDERVYARQVAQHFSVDLAELLEEEAAPRFDRAGGIALRPPPNALLQPLHRALARHLSLTGGDRVLDGAGGDNVFGYLNTASPALDAWRCRGPALGLSTLRDVAGLHGTTFWTAARAASRRWRRSRDRWRRNDSFLTPGSAAREPDHHPWLDAPASANPGDIERVQSIVGIHHFLGEPASGAGPAALHPLLAQPIMETCLRIPSWLWVSGGRDRAVARAAFRDLLPEAILARRSKGRLESMCMKGYMASRDQLEALLLDGRLAAEGLLDRAAVRDYLRRSDQPRDAGYIRLLEISAAETWLRSFSG